MEYKKLLKLTILNSLCLLVFAGFLSSCQKVKFPRTGHFTKIKTVARTIANKSDDDMFFEKFINFQDPKQIVIYCQLNSQKPEVCYNIHLSETINQFIISSKQNRSAEVKSLKSKLDYKSQVSKLSDLTEKAKNMNALLISTIVTKRKDFCSKNSKKDLEKCLNQYIKRDTFTVLNKYQSKFKLNGLEYLFLKQIINSELKSGLSSAKNEISSKRNPMT